MSSEAIVEQDATRHAAISELIPDFCLKAQIDALDVAGAIRDLLVWLRLPRVGLAVFYFQDEVEDFPLWPGEQDVEALRSDQRIRGQIQSAELIPLFGGPRVPEVQILRVDQIADAARRRGRLRLDGDGGNGRSSLIFLFSVITKILVFY